MIKYFTLLGLLFLLNIVTKAQNDTEVGMKFEHLPSMQSLFAKAKKENKLVFVDCYTTWCGPCKMMVANVFNKKEVGDFYNANYVNAKVQFDSTDKDDAYVKGWYKDAHDLQTKYDVYSFPSYLIFNGDGEIVHRYVGSMSIEAFIESGKKALNPDNQYYTQLRKYEAGDKSPEFILNLIEFSNRIKDTRTGKKLAQDYLSTQKDIYTKESLELLYRFTTSSKDKGFEIAYKEGDKADEILGESGASKRLIMSIVLLEEFKSRAKKDEEFDFNSFDAILEEKYPEHAKFFSDHAKLNYYAVKKDWNMFAKFAEEVVKRDDFVNQYMVNQMAGNVLSNLSDPKQLEKALSWAKLYKDKEPNAAITSTYAKLLYKLGKKEEAIAEQQKAVKLASKGAVEYFEETLEKMKKGESLDRERRKP